MNATDHLVHEIFADCLQKHNDRGMHKLFDYVKKNKNPHQERFTLKDKGGNLILNPEETKIELGKLWFEIVDKQTWPRSIEKPNPTTVLIILNEETESMFVPITRHEVVEAIRLLRNGMSPGTTLLHPDFF